MRLFGKGGERPWRVTVAAVGGLLAAIIVVGVVGLLLNRDIQKATDQALRYDVEIEDDGDDLRAAVLDLRDYQRTIYFGGPSRTQIENFEDAHEILLKEIAEFENPGARGTDIAQPDELRAMTGEYYSDFRSAIEEYERTGDQEPFDEANDLALKKLAALEEASAEIDELGERLTEDSVARVERAAASATVVLLAVIGGLLLSGVVLAYAAVRVVAELRLASTKLTDASRAKTDFLADASHELRTPLTVLRGNAQIGLSLEGSLAHREILEDIVTESGRMTRMVEDLLLLARSDSASLPLEIEAVSIPAFLKSLAERAGALARERGAKLDTRLSGEGVLDVDRSHMEQAVLILVDNAAKYGPPEGSIILSSRICSEKLLLTVADEGPGMPEEELPRVFERFYRVDKTRSRKLGGSGLGLPIASTIVEAHGGAIEAESVVGEGTRMSISLPLASGADGGKRFQTTSPEASAHF